MPACSLIHAIKRLLEQIPWGNVMAKDKSQPTLGDLI